MGLNLTSSSSSSPPSDLLPTFSLCTFFVLIFIRVAPVERDFLEVFDPLVLFFEFLIVLIVLVVLVVLGDFVLRLRRRLGCAAGCEMSDSGSGGSPPPSIDPLTSNLGCLGRMGFRATVVCRYIALFYRRFTFMIAPYSNSFF